MRLVGLAIVSSTVAACSMWGEEVDPTRDWSARRLYDAAKGNLDRGSYEDAIEYYEKLDSRYPFGPLAMQAQLDLIYAYFKDDDPVSAIAAADRFIKLHPRHPSVDYAYYLKGLVTFVEGETLTSRFFPKDMSEHDPGNTLQSFRSFQELVQQFPESRYAEDSRQRMLYLRNVLAAHEINVARYYMKREAWLAAVNRSRYVVENFQRTPAVSDALVIMAEAYRNLGLAKLAADAERVLSLNYPELAGDTDVQPASEH